MGKNASLLLNLILIVAIVPLYLMHFSKDQGSSPQAQEEDATDTEMATDTGDSSLDSVDADIPEGDLRVAYVNWDTLMNEYQYVDDMLSELEEEKIQMRKQLEGEMRQLEKEYRGLKEESTYMTQDELKKAQQRMQQKQQKLRQRQQNLQTKLARKEQKMTKKFFDNVSKFLEEYNKDSEFDLILRYQRGGELLFAEKGYNITPQILNGLNERYEEEGADKKMPKVDSLEQESPLNP